MIFYERPNRSKMPSSKNQNSASGAAEEEQFELWSMSADRWSETRRRFLNAISPELRSLAEQRLKPAHYNGPGMRMWLNSIFCGSSLLPDRIPDEVVKVYLTFSEAVPLFDCELCGLALPVIPSRTHGFDWEPDKVFFPTCPTCGGQTGHYSWSARRAVAGTP